MILGDQMNIDRDTPICGVKPALLKALMRHGRFDTPKAMLLLGMAEPHISQTLRQLADAGWLSWDGDRDSIDQWRSTSLGHRLAASRLIRRFPISQGRALLPKIVEVARTLNANPSASHRIAEIILFGSILTGQDHQDAGDVDLVVHVVRRKLPEKVLNALIETEELEMPNSLDFLQRLSRQESDLKRAIKKVSNKISLHGFSDVEIFSAPHRQLYGYDVETETEIVPDPEVRVVHSAERLALDEERIMPPKLYIRDWPAAPKAPVVLKPMDTAPFRLAQHLWMKGANARDIAKRLNLSVQTVTAYLASRQDTQYREKPKFDVNLDWMIDKSLEVSQKYAVMVRIVKQHAADVKIKCNAFDIDTLEELADIRIFGISDTWISGRCDLQPMLEPVAQAAAAWWEKMRDQFVGLDLRLLALGTSGYGRTDAFGSRRPDFRPLVAPMRELLEQLLPKPLGLEAFEHSLEFIRKLGRDQLFHRIGNPWHAGSVSTLITRRNYPATWRKIKAIIEPQADLIQPIGDFALAVDACHIDGVSDAIRNSWADID